MDIKLQEKCDRLADCREKLSKAFASNDGSIQMIAAAMLASTGKDVPVEKLKECKDLVKRRENLFSEYRSYAMEPLVTYLSVSDDPERMLERIQKSYEALKKHFGSTYKLMAALSVADRTADGEELETAEKMSRIRDLLKEKYRWSVPDELVPYLALMATSGKSVEEIAEEAAGCFDDLENLHLGKEERKALACVLSMGKGEIGGRCGRLKEQAEAMKMNRAAIFSNPNRVILGILPLVTPENAEVDHEKLAAQITEIDEYLKKQKGGSWLSVEPEIRKSVAVLLAALAGGNKEDYEADVLLDSSMKQIMETHLITTFIIARNLSR